MSFFNNNRNRRTYGELTRPSRTNQLRLPRWPKFKGVYLKKLAVLAVVTGLLLFLTGTVVVIWVSRDLPSPDKLADRSVSQSTKIYDRTGTRLLYEIYQNQKRTIVNLDQIAPLAIKATIAVEDKYFYEHSGIRLLSILRAGFNNLIGRRSGGGGASTLTQQFIKKTIVGEERTVFRKIKEAILAMRLEKKYTKDDILKMYLNEIPYGSTNYGMEAASQSYFHKSAKDLDLAESATLAAMIQAPSRYLNNPNALRGRRDLVLKLMFDQSYITAAQKNAAQNSALRLYRTAGIIDAPHFVLYVKQLLADQFGEKTMDTDGLKVITTLDYDKQKMAEKIIKEEGDKMAKSANANNAALVALDPKTAQILAMVGSRDFYDETIDGQFNVAVLGRRQPGSSFKPFVYTLAWQKGYTPETMLYDVSTNFDRRSGGNYTPKNYDNKEHGLVTMRQALQGSLNIPAVKTLYLAGLKDVIDFAKLFGYTTLKEDAGLSLVLGGSEVSLLEHTNGYATLANNGLYHPPVSLLKVTDAQGNTLYEWKEELGAEAIKPELAASISNVLTDNNARAFIFGAKNNLILPDRPVAAKTGTTNDNKDAWTLGYTPSLTAGVWVGNTLPSPMKGGGNLLAGVIWNKFMRGATASTSVEQFPAPPLNDAQKPILRGAVGGIKLTLNGSNGKIATSSTPDWLKIERTYLPPHDILYYVDKDDPRGPMPPTPDNDPQYQVWEDALQDWVNRERAAGKEYSFAEPPAEDDNTLPSSELTPQLEILSPANSSTLTARQIEIKIKASAPRGVARVNYFIDNTDIGNTQTFPFNLSYYAKNLPNGAHALRVRALDDLNNGAEKEIYFTLQAELDPPNVDWFDGSPLTLKTEDFPRSFNLAPWRWDAITEIKIYLQNGANKKWIYTFNHAEDKLFNNTLNFTWKRSPGAGNYSLIADLADNKGGTKEKILNVEIK